MTLDKNLEVELKSLSQPGQLAAMLEVNTAIYGTAEKAIIAIIEQSHWTIVQRAMVNGQDAVEKEK